MIHARTVLHMARSVRFDTVCAANPVVGWDDLSATDDAARADPILAAYDRAIAVIQAEIDAIMSGPEMV